MAMLSPEQFLAELERRAGRSATAAEIASIKQQLPNWQGGIDASELEQFIPRDGGAEPKPAPGAGGGVIPPEEWWGGGYGPNGEPYNPRLYPTPNPTPQPGPTGTPGTTPGPETPPFPTFVPPPTPQTGTYNPGTYTPGTYQAPTFHGGDRFNAPPAFQFDPFQYQEFKAPTQEEAASRPGYAFARDEGMKALQNAQASKGLLRTGGSLKDLFSWGNNFATQNYGNQFSQDAQVYNTNRGNAYENWSANRANAAGNYMTNYGISRDTFDTNYGIGKDTYTLNANAGKGAFDTNEGNRAGAFGMNEGNQKGAFDTNTANAGAAYDRTYTGAKDAFNADFRGKELTFDDLYKRWRDKLNATTQIATAGAL